MDDLISRQAAIDALDGNVIVKSRESAQAVMDYIRGCADRIRSLPSAQPENTCENTCEIARTSNDCISRQAAIDALTHKWDGMVTSVFDVINSLPSAQPEKRTENTRKTHACDCIERQAAIDVIRGWVNKALEDWGYATAEIQCFNAIYPLIMALPSAHPDLDSAYTEGYTQAEAKYRKMWDEMQANIKEKAFGKRKGLIHTADIDAMPTIEPEQKVEELLPDGTLHLFTDTDLSKVDRVLVSQNGTHFGDLYYADGEPKIGKWIYNSPVTQKCNQCGFVMPDWDCHRFKYCPNCKARMVQEGEDNDS